MDCYTVATPTVYETPRFGEVCRAYFDGLDLQFEVDGGTPVTVATLTSQRPVGIAEDPDGTLRVRHRNDAGDADVEYVSRLRGASGSWA